jgi:hypothetical protein
MKSDKIDTPIKVLLSKDQLSKLDQMRGDVPRSAWVRRVIQEKLENERLNRVVRDL